MIVTKPEIKVNCKVGDGMGFLFIYHESEKDCGSGKLGDAFDSCLLKFKVRKLLPHFTRKDPKFLQESQSL